MSRSARRSPGRWLALVLSLGLLGGFALTGVAAPPRDITLIAPITLATGKQGKTIRCGCHVGPVAIAPRRAIATTRRSDPLYSDGGAVAARRSPTAHHPRPAARRPSPSPPSAPRAPPAGGATGTKGRAINVGSAVDNLAITPNGKRAYVITPRTDALVPIALATRTLGKLIHIGRGLNDIAITPDGKRAYVVP